MIIQPNDDIFPVVRDRFAAEQIQHSFQVGESICLLPGDKMQSPPVPPHQIVDDNFTAKFTGGVGFVIPAQPSEDVDHSSLKHFILILVQLLKCAPNVRFTDFRKLSYSSERYHVSRACASINDSIPERCIRPRQISRSRLRVMAFIAVSGLSMSQQPQRKSCFMAQSRAGDCDI